MIATSKILLDVVFIPVIPIYNLISSVAPVKSNLILKKTGTFQDLAHVFLMFYFPAYDRSIKDSTMHRLLKVPMK